MGQPGKIIMKMIRIWKKFGTAAVAYLPLPPEDSHLKNEIHIILHDLLECVLLQMNFNVIIKVEMKRWCPDDPGDVWKQAVLEQEWQT